MCGVSERRLSVSLKQSGPIPLDVEFGCGAGEVLAIFGPSGSGKTTILRAIAGLYQPDRASVQSNGATWTDTTTGTFVPPHKRAAGFVFQEYALFPHLTAEGNVATALGHLPRAARPGRARQLLRSVRLEDKAQRRPQELSGGERQRVALARALAREPAVLLLDEPFAAVDRDVRRSLQEEVTALRRTLDVPMILVTHDFDDVVRLATHVLLLEHGRGIACGPVTTLMSRPDLAWLREAVGLGDGLRGDSQRRDGPRAHAAGVRRRTAARVRQACAGRHDGPRPDPGARSDSRDARAGGAELAQRAGRPRVGAPHRSRASITSSSRSPSAACCCSPK